MSSNRAPKTNIRGKSSRGRGSRRPRRRNGGESVGTYFSDAWSLAKRTAVGLNEIRRLINTEEKFIDTTLSGSTSRAGSVQYLVPVAQGDNISDRTGDSIKTQSLYVQGYVFFNTASTTPQTARLIVFRDLQNLGTAPVGSDLIQSAGTGFATTAPYNFVNGKQLTKRFSILYDEFITLDSSNQTGIFSFNTNADKHTFYRGTTAASTDAAAGAYYYCVFTDASTNVPTYAISTRVVFTDD